MRRREVERIARRAVPGSGAPQVSPLSAGLLHHTFRVQRDGRAFSMQLPAPTPRWLRRAGSPSAPRYPGAHGAWLLEVVQRAAEQALAPPLVYGDARRGVIVHSWVDGHAWPHAAVRRTRNIEKIAALLRRVHALSVPAPARAITPAHWVRYYSAALAAQRRGARERAAALAAAAAGKLQRLETLPAVTGVVCHSDLHRLNLLECRAAPAAAGGLLLLDWEYAHVAEPFWDLAGWSANNDYSELLQRRLLAAYLERAPDEAHWSRCKLLSWLYDYVCLLWSEVCLGARCADARELAPRAALLESRLLADPN